MYSYFSVATCSFFGGPQNVKNQMKISKNVSAYLFPPFINSTRTYSYYIKQYTDIKKYPYIIKITLKEGSTHNLTLHFGHLNWILFLFSAKRK